MMREVMDYGMFTEAGNMVVHGIVEGARLKKSTWPEVHQMLCTISEIKVYGEATDTVVREAVYDALRFKSPFYC